MTDELQQEFYDEGWAAFCKNESFDSCPYWPETVREAWERGWNDAADELIK